MFYRIHVLFFQVSLSFISIHRVNKKKSFIDIEIRNHFTIHGCIKNCKTLSFEKQNCNKYFSLKYVNGKLYEKID